MSTIVGPKAVIPVTTDARIFSEGLGMTGKRLNLWFLIIGRSRWSRKSTVIGYVEDFLRATVGNEVIASTIATPEALVDELAEHNHKAWLMDVFGIILEASRRKDYMTDLTGILQKLYGGRTFTRRTRGRGRVTVEESYLTVLASTTPFAIRQRLLDESMFVHGFLNRFLIVWDEGADKIVPIGERLLRLGGEEYERKARELVEYGKMLVRVDRVLILEPVAEVREALNEVNTKVYTVKPEDEIVNLYLGNLTDFLLRLSAVYRLARLEGTQGAIISIEHEDYERAYMFIHKVVLPSLKTQLEEVRRAKTVRPKELRAVRDLMEIVRVTVLRHGKKWEDGTYTIDRTTLYRIWNSKTRAGRKELDEVLAEFEELGVLETHTLPSDGGRPRVVYHFDFRS